MTGPLRAIVAIACVTLASASTAHAEDDVPLARSHFAVGLELYDRGRYEEAAQAFERARAVSPRPQLDYNIGRSYERAGRAELAIEAYRRFLAAEPEAQEAGAVRQAVAQLEEAVQLAARRRPAERPRRRGWTIGAVAVGSVAIAAGAAATGAYLAPWSDYRALTERCGAARTCSPAEVEAMSDRLRVAEGVGYGLFAVAGVAAAVDVFLIVRAVRGRR